jgi:hypothetical protein
MISVWILHIAVGLIGAYLVFLTFVMEETTEGVWVNRIENLWVALDDRAKSISETTRLLFAKVADKVSQAFNRVFGSKFLSARAIGVSSSLSFTSFFFVLALVIEGLCYLIAKHSDAVKPELVKQLPLLVILGFGLLAVAGVCAVLALLPILLRSRIWAWLSCLPAIFSSLVSIDCFAEALGTPSSMGSFLQF